jgi:lysophospholipase L1-like esterase
MAEEAPEKRFDTNINIENHDILNVAGFPSLKSKLEEIDNAPLEEAELPSAFKALAGLNMRAAFLQFLGLQNGGNNPNVKPILLIFIGDSNTYGFQDTSTSYPKRLDDAYGSNYVIVNKGVNGNNSANILTRVVADVDSLFDTEVYSDCYAFLLIGTNDGSQGVPLETTVGNIETFITGRQAKGINVGLLTYFCSNRTEYQPFLDALNPRIKALATQYNTLIVDAAAESVLANPNDGKYFKDGLHLTPLGYSYVARDVKTVLDAALALKGITVPDYDFGLTTSVPTTPTTPSTGSGSPIAWVNLAYSTQVDSLTLTMVGGGNATTQAYIPKRTDYFFEITVTQNSRDYIIGFAPDYASQFDFNNWRTSIHFSTNQFRPHGGLPGTGESFTQVVPGDVIRLQQENDKVVYYLNGQPKYTYTDVNRPVDSQRINVAILGGNAEVVARQNAY